MKREDRVRVADSEWREKMNSGGPIQYNGVKAGRIKAPAIPTREREKALTGIKIDQSRGEYIYIARNDFLELKLVISKAEATTNGYNLINYYLMAS